MIEIGLSQELDQLDKTEKVYDMKINILREIVSKNIRVILDSLDNRFFRKSRMLGGAAAAVVDMIWNIKKNLFPIFCTFPAPYLFSPTYKR